MRTIKDKYETGSRAYRLFSERRTFWRQWYRNVRIVKSPTDLLYYQEVFCDLGVRWVLETGTNEGGSALFYADMLDRFPGDGLVVTIDSVRKIVPAVEAHPRVRFVQGDSEDPKTVLKALSLMPPKKDRKEAMFVCLDSDHGRDHVLMELMAYVPAMKKGDFLAVEDTNYCGDDGPAQALKMFRCEGLVPDETPYHRYFGLTCSAGGLFRAESDPRVLDPRQE